MLKKNLTREESLTLATDLGLTKYIAVDDLIEGLQIDQNKEVKVCLTITDKAVAEYVLRHELDIVACINSDCVVKVKAFYGPKNSTITTEYGELSVDDVLLSKVLASSRKDIECTIKVLNDSLKNLNLTIIYMPEYNYIDNDTWRYMMLESDKTIMVLNANHILYTGEQEFIRSLVIPYHSSLRLLFGIGNAQYIKSSEWTDAVARVHMLTNENYCVFPIFTEEISDERRSRYAGYDVTLDTILSETQQNLIYLREVHFEDLAIYKSSVFESSLVDLKSQLESATNAGIIDVNSAQVNQKVLVESREHLESNISLFLESPLIAKYRTAVEQFAELLKKSIKEDILTSKNIKQDARALPRYLSTIWEQFSDDQNIELYNEFERESSALIDMMNLDLRHITRNICTIEIKNDVKKQLDSAFNVHTFFARKTNSGNSLTDALTIGGLLATVFTPLGLAAVFASEVVKIVGKESIDNEHKKVLIEKTTDVIERNKAELLHQADCNFCIIAENFRKEIMSYYDEIMKSIDAVLKEEKERLEHATETINIINELI